MIAVAYRDGSGLMVVLCCAGISWCFWRCVRARIEDVEHGRSYWWERRP